VKIYDGDGKDFEGDALATISAFYGLLISAIGPVTYQSGASAYKGEIIDGGILLQSVFGDAIGDMPITFTAQEDGAELTITVIGASA
jgi:hypothetical protein